MSVLPRDVVDRMQWIEDHTSAWTTNALGIGTTVLEVGAVATKTATARAAYTAQQTAQDVAKAATEALKQAVANMTNGASAIIEQVRVKARSAGPGVYPLAQIPVPATPAPMPPPGKPEKLTVMLDESGALNLKWKCPNPVGSQGTMYQIWRRIGAATEFEYIGSTGSKKFADNALPAGSAAVTYQIQAVRSTSVGPWAQFNVNFGVGGGGTMTAMVTETSPTKMAA